MKFCRLLLLFIVGIAFLFPADLSAQATPSLQKIKTDTLQYFLKYSNPKTGLTPDSSSPHAPASIAATGFHILALVIAAENQVISKEAAFSKIKNILKTLKSKAEHKNGFFYHFISHNSGKRVWSSEASSIDTAIVVACALVAAEYFKGGAVEKLAWEIYDRVDWKWMQNGTELMSHGWKPEVGFLPYYWDTYSEHLILQALAIGARENAVSPSSWSAWFRVEDNYKDHKVIYAHSGALFTYQYSHIFIDFRKLFDLEINYFDNSINATHANREFCLDNAANFKTYEEEFWGLSACLGPKGYKAYGAMPGRGFHDGTVAPYAVISSLIFTPDEATQTIQKMFTQFQNKVYGGSGFYAGFNVDQNWFANSYIGVDQGATVGIIENHQTELIWKLFMRLEPIHKWIKLCNLKGTSPDAKPDREVIIYKVKPPTRVLRDVTTLPVDTQMIPKPKKDLSPFAKLKIIFNDWFSGLKSKIEDKYNSFILR